MRAIVWCNLNSTAPPRGDYRGVTRLLENVHCKFLSPPKLQ